MSADDRTRELLEREIAQLNSRVAALDAEARRFKTTLRSIGDAVIAVDTQGRIIQMNPVAEALSAWVETEALGLPLASVFRIVNEETGATVESPVERVQREGIVVGLANHTVLITKDGTEIPIADSGAPIRDENGDVTGVVLVFRDQTEERAALEALHDSEARFRSVFENSPLGKSMTDIAGGLRVNQSFASILGYSKDELCAKAWQEITHPDDVQRSADIIQSIVNGERTQARWEKRYIHRSGRVVWTDITTALQRDQHGKPLFFITTISDITDRKQAEQQIARLNAELEAKVVERTSELRDEMELVQKILSASPVGVFACRADGACVMANPAVARISGASIETMLKLDFHELAEWRRNGLYDKAQTALATGIEQRSAVHLTTSFGRDAWLSYIFTTFERKGVPHFLMLVDDITDRKRAEAALHDGEQRLAKEMATVTEIVGEMLSGDLTDRETDRQVLNACLDVTGSVYGMIGAINQLGKWDTTTYAGPTTKECALPGALTSESSTGMDFRGICGLSMMHGKPVLCNNLSDHPDRVGLPKGHVPIQRFLGIPIKREGKVTGMVAVANKADGYTEADEQVLTRLVDVMVVSRHYHELLTELESRVRDRTAQLEESNQELEAFSYSVSHDLRAPLRAIDGFTRMLAEDYAPQFDAEGKRVCGIIHENTVKMSQLIDDLLAFSRLGRTEMSLSRIDMQTMANSVFHELTTPDSRARIDLHVGSLPPALADTTLMRQVWTNLLSNAIKFSSKLERATIQVSAEHINGDTVYTVKDNGAGFDMQYVHKLFGVFQRLHNTKEFEGTGVGLALVQRVIRRHGGRVWAESQVDSGATFYFSLQAGGT